MSSGLAPCSGYCVKATEEAFVKLGVALPQDDFEESLQEIYDSGGTFIAKINGLEVELEIFDKEGDIYDTIDDDDFYIIFPADLLYEQKTTDSFKELSRLGIEPSYERWTNYG